MFSHTKDILSLTVPFLTVLIVVSLLTAGVVDKNTLSSANETEIKSEIIIVNPTSIPSSFEGRVENNINQTDQFSGSQEKDIVPTITIEPIEAGQLLPEAAATQSAEISIEKCDNEITEAAPSCALKN